MSTRRTLLAMLAFVCLIVGSFIWFVATWDKEKEVPVTWVQTTERPS